MKNRIGIMMNDWLIHLLCINEHNRLWDPIVLIFI